MAGEDSAADAAPAGGVLGSIKGLASTLIAAVHTRLQLFTTELAAAGGAGFLGGSAHACHLLAGGILFRGQRLAVANRAGGGGYESPALCCHAG